MERDLRAFLAVVRHGNLTTAASVIGRTQPALTKSIRRLEDEVGARLFERSTRGMELSESGRIFLDRARSIETHWAQAKEEAAARSGGVLSEFRIAAGAAFHMRMAPLTVRQLATEFPETRFVLDIDLALSSLPLVRSGEIHLLLGAFLIRPPDGVVTEQLLTVETGVIACSTHPLAQLESVPPGALENESWLIYKRDTHMRDRLNTYCLQHRLPPPKVAVEVDALAAGLAIARGTRFLVPAPTTLRPLVEEAGLRFLSVESPVWEFPSGAWMRGATREYPIMQRALAILREQSAAHSIIPRGY